jgi:hypothetical protein
MYSSLKPTIPARLLLALVGVAALLTVLTVLNTDEAPTAEAAVGTTYGCSYVPDSGPWFNFLNACLKHDGCYINHWLDKVGCDYQFLQNMRSYCYGTYQWWQWQRNPCLSTAWTYYSGVNTVGWACYNNWIRC